MQNLNIYITEKLRIGKETIVTDLLDKIYKDIDELVDDLNVYFGNDLVKPIKIIDKTIAFKPTDRGLGATMVYRYFVIEKKNTSVKFRFGLNNGNLVFQRIERDYRGKLVYGNCYHLYPYEFNKQNFKEWISRVKFSKSGIQKFLNIKNETA